MATSASPTNRWLRRLSLAGILATGTLALGALGPKYLSNETKTKHLTHVINRGDLAVTVTENGAVESSNNKEIKCLVKGGSTVLWVIETGTMVKPGDELVKLDQSQIEDKILQQKIVYENALANKITAESDVAVAKTSVTEYLEGTYKEERSKVEKEIFEAEQALRKTELSLQSALRLTAKGVVKDLQLEGEQFAVDSARKDLELKKTRLDSLEKYNKVKSVQELQSKLRAAEAKLASYEASLSLEEARLEREKKQLENCIIRADTDGMVIFPSMAAWKDTPDIAEGAVVREQQTLLMIPDVTQMQVKVGIHESKVDRLKIGMKAKVQLQELVLDGEVSEIAEVTRPAGWWTEGAEGTFYCGTQSADAIRKKIIRVGDTNDQFTVILDGLTEGDEVILNPLSFIEEAQEIAMQFEQQLSQTKGSKESAATPEKAATDKKD